MLKNYVDHVGMMQVCRFEIIINTGICLKTRKQVFWPVDIFGFLISKRRIVPKKSNSRLFVKARLKILGGKSAKEQLEMKDNSSFYQHHEWQKKFAIFQYNIEKKALSSAFTHSYYLKVCTLLAKFGFLVVFG